MEDLPALSHDQFQRDCSTYLRKVAEYPQAKLTRSEKQFALLKNELKATTHDRGKLGRWQVQLPLMHSVLTVDNHSRYLVLQLLIIHPRVGVAGCRMDRSKFETYPLILPSPFQRVDANGAYLKFNSIISRLYALRRKDEEGSFTPSSDPVDVFYHSLLALSSQRPATSGWDALELPPTFIPLRRLQPDVAFGDLLIWNGFHGSASPKGLPAATMFLDMCDRSLLSSRLRNLMYKRICEGPLEFGGGSATSRNERWNIRFNQFSKTSGSVAELPTLGRYLFGDDEAIFDESEMNPEILPPAMMAQLKANGYLVVQMKELLPLDQYSDWLKLCSSVQSEFESFFNYVIFQSQVGSSMSSTYLRFSDEYNELWSLLGGSRRVAEHLTGDPFFLYCRYTKPPPSYALFEPVITTNKRTHNPQKGGTRLSSSSGMGAATNAYDLPSQLAIQTHPAVYRLFAQLYETQELLAIPERFRIKTGGSLKTHIDRVIQFPTLISRKCGESAGASCEVPAATKKDPAKRRRIITEDGSSGLGGRKRRRRMPASIN